MHGAHQYVEQHRMKFTFRRGAGLVIKFTPLKSNKNNTYLFNIAAFFT